MSRRPQPSKVIRDRDKYEKWLRGDTDVTAREAMYTCAECHHANRAFPKATLAFGRPGSKFCPIRGNVIHGRNHACKNFVLRADLLPSTPDHE